MQYIRSNIEPAGTKNYMNIKGKFNTEHCTYLKSFMLHRSIICFHDLKYYNV